jgi:hypothetical protein
MIEKARAASLRDGFLISLDHYLASSHAPPDYVGWLSAKQRMSECTARRRAGLCPRKIAPKELGCECDGFKLAAPLVLHKYTLPALLGSFTSFTAVLHTLAFVFFTATFAVCMAQYVRDTYGMWRSDTLVYFISGFFIAPLAWRRRWVIGLVLLAVVAAIIFGAVSIQTPICVRGTSALGGTIFGIAAYYLCRHFREIRIGRRSVEAYTYTWFVMFAHCRDRGTKTSVETSVNKLSWWRRGITKFATWFFQDPTPDTTLDNSR